MTTEERRHLAPFKLKNWGSAVPSEQENEARAKLAQVQRSLSGFGLSYAELESPFGLGVGIAFQDDSFVVVGVPLGGDTAFYVTSGAAYELPRGNKVHLLEICNEFNAAWAAPTCCLHDADDMWSVLVQHKLPLPIAADVPPYLNAVLHSVASGATEAWERLAEAQSGGHRWIWNDSHAQALLTKSMI